MRPFLSVGTAAPVALPFLCKLHNSTSFFRKMFVQLDEKKILKTP
jgi:hypothetical protein